MANPRDYYDLLGIRRSASANEIGGAFRRMSKAYHPDLNKSPGAAERMKEINEAYDTLSDPQKRAAYDSELDRARRTRTQTPHSWRENPSPPRRGPDVRISVSLAWEEALYGTELDLFVNGRRLVVDIPGGIDDGTTLRLSGQGEQGANGGRPGDVFVHVRVEYPVDIYYSKEYYKPAPKPDRKRSDDDGCSWGCAAIGAVLLLIPLWIASGC